MNKRREIYQGILPIIIFIALWEITARLNLLQSSYFLPPFSTIILQFYNLTVNGMLRTHFLSSLFRVLIGFSAGSLAGLAVGILMGWKKLIHKTFSPLISLIYPIPALGWLPLLILWFGISNILPIMIIFICSFFPITYNTITGIRSVNKNYIRAAKTLGASNFKILTSVVIPLALPNIFTGLKLESGMAWRVVIAAEMIAIPSGIGALMMKAENLIRIDIIIVCLLLLSIMCFTFEKVIELLEKKLTGRWR